MALVNTLSGHGGQQPSAPLISLTVLVTFDASYPTGGEDFDPAALLQSLGNYDKAPTVLAVVPEMKAGFILRWDRATTKMLVFFADYDAVADGALIEVTNAFDLAAAGLTAVEVTLLAK